MNHPTDDELRKRRQPSEDHFTERKTFGDSKDWLKTMVAFANSIPIGRHGVLYIGVRDDGTVQGRDDLDSTQRTLAEKLATVFPKINYVSQVLVEDGKEYLCVIVSPDPKRPHFSGPAYIREGSRTVVASETQYQRLLNRTHSKADRLLEAEGHSITVTVKHRNEANQQYHRFRSGIMTVVDCSPHTLTLKTQYGFDECCPLDGVTITREDPHVRSSIDLLVLVE